MSRQLPPKPNLEHLKKQAKELLRQMRPAKLSDAQHALANEYGFATWTKLKAHVEALTLSPAEVLKSAVCDCDAERVSDTLKRYPELLARIDAPLPGYGPGQHALFAAVQRSDRGTIDVLLHAGANIHQRTADGFGVLDECHPDLAEFLLTRGAVLNAHSASRLGFLTHLRIMLEAHPGLSDGRGAGGRMPLHFASTVEIAELLLARGANIDPRDLTYNATPAQHMLRVEHKRHYLHDRQPVARYLVSRGCQTDILMAAALGDGDSTKKLLASDPECIRTRVEAGSVYASMLGERRTAHSVARDFGHEDVFHLLMRHTPSDLRFELACELGEEATIQEIARLSLRDPVKLPNAARSNNTSAVRLMLAAGWPVEARGEMGATALHWAAFNGNAEMTREILKYHPELELKSREQESTAFDWAVFGSGNGWHSESGDYAGTVQWLLQAGAAVPPHWEELEPSEDVLQVLIASARPT